MQAPIQRLLDVAFGAISKRTVFEHQLQLVDEISYVFEVAIDAGESNKGNLIDQP